MKENLHFKQLRLNYINNQKKNKNRMHKIDNSLYWGSIVIAKIDDEVFFKYYQDL